MNTNNKTCAAAAACGGKRSFPEPKTQTTFKHGLKGQPNIALVPLMNATVEVVYWAFELKRIDGLNLNHSEQIGTSLSSQNFLQRREAGHRGYLQLMAVIFEITMRLFSAGDHQNLMCPQVTSIDKSQELEIWIPL